MLTFPFNQDMYDQGLVVRMPRSKLVDYVNVAAEDAEVDASVREELIDAVGKLDVATVAVGAYRRATVPDCNCPAALAGYIRRNVGWLEQEPEVRQFPLRFDCLIWRTHRRAMVIEVVND